MNYKFIEGYRPGDWVCYCAICDQKVWASDTFKLAPQTGRGGLIVCPECVDIIDYGIVPYKVPAERPVPFTNYLLPSPIDQYPSVDYEKFNPLTTTPQQLISGANPISPNVWNNVLNVWNFWTVPWGS